MLAALDKGISGPPNNSNAFSSPSVNTPTFDVFSNMPFSKWQDLRQYINRCVFRQRFLSYVSKSHETFLPLLLILAVHYEINCQQASARGELWPAKPLAGDRKGQKEMRLLYTVCLCRHNIISPKTTRPLAKEVSP